MDRWMFWAGVQFAVIGVLVWITMLVYIAVTPIGRSDHSLIAELIAMPMIVTGFMLAVAGATK